MGSAHGTLALLLGAAASAVTATAVGLLASLALAVLLVATAPRVAPQAVAPPPSRQHDPTTPGRPRPRAPGATSLPCAR
ncbi:hypothetical protein DNL40_13170 [Xylanimonas oleitrophica]|uniref:Uncharacterized protein n=1 Tax=Xylanimonas oleitrophica TaxID=2607479 RepID=A0A2W5XRC6_9MICO|nr:hypothetical protein DNL40_13170 [Xylanimonas oleitrophica]